jgi:hypothetical protein
MDVIKLINKALSDDDIGTTLGADAKNSRYSELRHIDDLDDLLTQDMDYCIILYEDRPDRGTGLPCRSKTVYTSTSTRTAIDLTNPLSG